MNSTPEQRMDAKRYSLEVEPHFAECLKCGKRVAISRMTKWYKFRCVKCSKK